MEQNCQNIKNMKLPLIKMERLIMYIPALDHDIIDETFRCSNFLQIEEMKIECEPLNWFLKEDNYLHNFENF